MVCDAASAKSIETTLDACISSYGSTNSQIYAQRATILHYELLKGMKAYKIAPGVLIRSTNEDMMPHNGLLVEQAALCFLKTKPIMMKKFAFHMILAGHRYNKCSIVRFYLSLAHSTY